MKIPNYIKKTLITILLFIGLQWSLQDYYWLNVGANTFVFALTAYHRFRCDPATNG